MWSEQTSKKNVSVAQPKKTFQMWGKNAPKGIWINNY